MPWSITRRWGYCARADSFTVSIDPLAEHLGYVSDRARLQRFGAAIAAAVKPGDRVADLGCGCGILGLLCLRAGAAHVYAIDDGVMLDLAKESMVRCGFADRVTFLRGRSQKVELPEKVDVVVCDHVGGFGFDYMIIDLLRDAHRRFLKPGGICIPSGIRLHVAPVESHACRKLAEGWRAPGVPAEFHWLSQYSVNSKHLVNLKRGELLGPPADLGALEAFADHPEYLSWSASLTMERPGMLHGLAGWFEASLAPGITMTNSPLSDDKIDRAQAFLAIEEAMPVEAGERVDVRVMTRPDDGLIAWNVALPRNARVFRHSTWASMSLSAETLRNSQASRVPRPTPEGRARTTVLGYCDGRRTAQEIEAAILRDHPSLFPSEAEIRRFVLGVLARDTR